MLKTPRWRICWQNPYIAGFQNWSVWTTKRCASQFLHLIT